MILDGESWMNIRRFTILHEALDTNRAIVTESAARADARPDGLPRFRRPPPRRGSRAPRLQALQTTAARMRSEFE